ncbi:MAG TPA: HD domain-containing phosphohydrolase [Solirubrobacterales bacterium]|jgi:HD-GYP domain-containing protein (c-di-GMP phosphodiesterase class II)|nr:HD domain-containing phosphohydrolase [Solirubrobacterales bacterium]
MARESRDGYPSEFATELRTLVDALCQKLKVDTDTHVEALKVAGLQDLGMLGVNHVTLAADRSLTDQELAEVRKAPLVAQNLVARMPGYEKAADAVRHAHERWDGNGYPDGLTGTKIPLASRIVAVCLAYQAMSSPRPFRAAMHPRVVCDELQHGAGTQFDPDVVTALLDVIRPLADQP